jgi:hypothetical protein
MSSTDVLILRPGRFCVREPRLLSGTVVAIRDGMNNQSQGGSTMATEFSQKDYSRAEGRVAKAIEDQTTKLPSDTFLWVAIGTMAFSATMQALGNKHASLFVGQWAPTLLILGLYNKLVKQLGSDRTENAV